MDASRKYLPYRPIELPARKWPNNRLAKAPIWCSVDLRDGNQALVEPMNLEEKLRMFEALVSMGFKEIEVGFPSASQVEFETVRALIEYERIPDDVTIQVLVQAREHLIRRTFEAVEGAKRVNLHLYTNLSPLFRRVVFREDKDGVRELVLRGARLVKELADEQPGTDVRFEFSPESFSTTEPDYAVEVCARALDVFGATAEKRTILNLPSTVQHCAPNYYADLIEYFIGHLPGRERAIISVHPHNDRGTSVADAELALLAGAERVEGTLFGNGERTGNLDLVTVGLNLYTQGIDPELDFTKLNAVKRVYERCTHMRIHERAPYAGELVFTAFAGSHQDAIKKGLDYRRAHDEPIWEVPYLPLDPTDIGREYEPIIRINSQSGKGGAAFILASYYGYNLPKAMHPEFGAVVKHEADLSGAELSAEQLLRLFVHEYVEVDGPYALIRHELKETSAHGLSHVRFAGQIRYHEAEREIEGEGNGPIDAFFGALQSAQIEGFAFASYHEHAISSGSDAKACAYIELTYRGQSVFGVGIDSNINIASIKGVLCAVNRARRREEA